MQKSAFKADAILFLASIIWGFAFVAQIKGMEHVGPMTYNALRFALGSLILLPLAFGKTSRAHADCLHGKRLWISIGVAGSLLAIASGFQQFGLLYTTAGKAGFITGLYVVIVPFLGYFIGYRSGLGVWGGATMAAIGLYFLSVTASFTIEHGDILVLISAFFWAFHVVFIGWLAPKAAPLRVACGQFALCSLLSAIAALVAQESFTLHDVFAGVWPILYGGVLSVGVGFTLQVVSQRHAPPAHAAIIMSLETVFAALAGWLILDELLSGRALLGCTLMLGGMLLAQLAALARNASEKRQIRREKV